MPEFAPLLCSYLLLQVPRAIDLAALPFVGLVQ
jgi:hypothetical protein